MFKIKPTARKRIKDITAIFLIVIWLAVGWPQIWDGARDLVEIDNAQAAAWYDSSWGYRKTLTIDYTKVSTTLSNFPVMVSTTDSNLTSYASSTGADILFTSSDGTTKLNHEIESYTSSTGKLIAWVNVTSLSNSANTVLYMYYGNTGAASQQAATSTWDSNYVGVWHMKEDPSGSAPQMKDSTSNANHGTAQGSMSSAAVVSAKVGNGLDFDGTSHYITIPTSSALAITGAITVETWVNMDAKTLSSRFVSKNNLASPNRGWELNYELSSPNADRVTMRIFDTTGSNARVLAKESSAVTTLSWFHYAGVFDPGVAVMIYKNGTQESLPTATAITTQKDYDGQDIWLAKSPSGSCSGYCYLEGKLDEIRISNVARSSGWILTGYNNVDSPSTFYSWGAAEPQPIVSVAITSDGSISYGTLLVGTSTTTIALGDTQTATNYGNVAEILTIKGQDTACPWTLTSVAGTDQYVHEFSTSSGSIWTPLTTSYQTLTSTVAVSSSQSFDLRISVPASTGCGTSQSVDVTVQAAAA